MNLKDLFRSQNKASALTDRVASMGSSKPEVRRRILSKTAASIATLRDERARRQDTSISR